MKLRNKILFILMATLLLIGGMLTVIWYQASSTLTNIYLEDVSRSSMRDACNTFGYLLTDTSYMATLVATNQKNIVDPVSILNEEPLMVSGQWNQTYLNNRRIILDYITALNGYKYYIAGITVVVSRDCSFNNSHVVQIKGNIYDQIQQLDLEKIKYSMIMMEPLHLEATKSTISSDYVLPGVRGITDRTGNLIGYTQVVLTPPKLRKRISMRKKVEAAPVVSAESAKPKGGRKPMPPEEKEAAAKARALEKEKAQNMRPEILCSIKAARPAWTP